MPTSTGPAVVEYWGAGGSGTFDTGGPAGTYGRLNAFSLTSGTPVTFSLGTPGASNGAAGGDTWWSSPSTAIAPGGGSGTVAIGNLVNPGGAGGISAAAGIAGGGGAGGPNGAGAPGGASSDAFHSGSGGGGSNGGGAGGVATSGLSGAGGTNFAGQSGGAASNSNGNPGVNNGTGGSGGFSDGSLATSGGNGAADFDLGGGGGGAGGNDGFDASGPAGAGGTPGGGSSAAYSAGGTSGSFASGGWAEIKITTPGGGAQFFYYGTYVPNVDTGFLIEPEGNEAVVATATSFIGGALSQSEANDTLISAARSLVAGSLVAAEVADALVSAGAVTGNFLVITEVDDALSATAGVLITGAFGQTEIPDALSAIGLLIGANLVETEASDTLVAAGALTISGGSLVAQEGDDSLSATALLTGIVANFSITEVDDAVFIVGQITGSIPTTSFNPSTADIGLYVLHRVGIARTMVTADHLADVQMAANFVLSDMATTQPNLWSVQAEQLPLLQGVPTYILPSNVLLVMNAFIRTTIGGIENDRVIFGVSRDDYAAYPNKLLQQPPTVYWADRSEPIKLNVYPAPDGEGPYTLIYYAVERDSDAAVGADTITSLPYRFLAAFKDMLVAELAPTYAMPKSAMFTQIAKESRARAMMQDREIVPLHITPGISRYYRG
jgi:hypothetical protein